MNADQCRRIIKDKLDAELYRHSLETAMTAAELAELYGADTGKAYLAGLVHDYGKCYTKDELLQKAELMGLSLDKVSRKQKRLLHAPVGAALIKAEFGIADPDITGAVACHTTGCRGMTLLQKVVYLADYIEPGRDFTGVETIRILARTDLNRALLSAVDNSIRSVLDRGFILHQRSVAFRNSLLAELAGEA